MEKNWRSDLAHQLPALDRADTLGEGGAIDEATQIALVTVEEARGVSYEPVLAEALETLGRLQVMGAFAGS